MEYLTLNKEITRVINLLSISQKEKLLEFIYTFVDVPKKKPSVLASFVGKIHFDDVKLMKTAIEQDCNKIDENEW
jgi:hypothetical protein